MKNNRLNIIFIINLQNIINFNILKIQSKSISGISTCIILFDQNGIFSSKINEFDISFSPSLNLSGNFFNIFPYNYKAKTLL